MDHATFLTIWQDDPKFREYCQSCGFTLLKYGWDLYKYNSGCDEYKTELDEKLKLAQIAIKSESDRLISEANASRDKLIAETNIIRDNLINENNLLKEKICEIEQNFNKSKINLLNEIKANEEKRITQLCMEMKTTEDRRIAEIKAEYDKLINDIKNGHLDDARINEIKMCSDKTISEMKIQHESIVTNISTKYNELVTKYNEMCVTCQNINNLWQQEKGKTEILEKNAPAQEVIQRLIGKSYNAGDKGAFGESFIETMLCNDFAGSVVSKCGKEACDLDFAWHCLRAKIEIKNYNSTIPIQEIVKFKRDMAKLKGSDYNCGFFMSLNELCMGEYNRFKYEWFEGILLVYIDLAGSADNLRMTINMACAIMETKLEESDKSDEDFDLIESFKARWDENEQSIKENDEVIKNLEIAMSGLLDTKRRLLDNRAAIKIKNRKYNWLTSDGTTRLDTTIKAQTYEEACEAVYNRIIKGSDKNQPVGKFITEIFGEIKHDATEVKNILIDRVVKFALHPNTFEKLAKSGVVCSTITKAMLEGGTLLGSSHVYKEGYSNISKFTNRPLDMVKESYKRYHAQFNRILLLSPPPPLPSPLQLLPPPL